MRISLSPWRCDEALSVVKNGDTLTIDGEAFDFTALPDGATIPLGDVPCRWLSAPVERIAGELHVTLLLPYGPEPETWQTFPGVLVTPPDGPLDLPTNTTVFVERTPVPGGSIVKTTTRKWHQPDQVDVSFEAAVEEAENVDA